MTESSESLMQLFKGDILREGDPNCLVEIKGLLFSCKKTGR